MGWFWSWSDSSSASSDAGTEITDQRIDDSATDGVYCINTEVKRTMCKTKQVKRGKFIRKCEKNKEIHRRCLGKPYRVFHTTIHTQEDLTALPKQVDQEPPLLGVRVRINVNVIERQMKSLMEAAEKMKSICTRGFAERK